MTNGQRSCYLAGNNYISWSETNSTTNTIFETRLTNCLTGWCAFSFSNNNSIEGSSFIFVTFENNRNLKTLLLTGHQNTHQKINEIQNHYYGDAHWEVNDIYQIYLNISIDYLKEDKNFLIFASNSKNRPYISSNGIWTIPKHEFVEIRNLEFEQKFCFEKDFFPKILEQLSPVAFFFLLINYIFHGILLVYYKNEQPLKSRGLFPFLSVFSGYWALVQNFIYLFTSLEWRKKYGCIFQDLGYAPTLTSSLVISFIYCLRIVLTLALNNNKNFIRNQNGRFTILFRIILFLKYLTSDIFMFLIYLSLYFLVVFEERILEFFTNGFNDCRTTSMNPSTTIYTLFLISLIGFIYFLDFILMFKEIIRCRFYKACIKDDPFYFRIQQWLFGTLVVSLLVFTIIYGAFWSFVTFFRSDIQYSMIHIFVYYTVAFVYSIFFYSTTLYFYGFVLLITIINSCGKPKKISDKSERESSLLEMNNCLKDDDLKEHFRKFCDSEWATENYLIYYDILAFENTKSFEERLLFAQQIFNTYLNGFNAPLEINISQNITSEIKQRIDRRDIDSEMFESVFDEVVKNLLDTFSRFRIKRVYLNHMEANNFVQSQVVN
eukprot:gene12362-6030_t